VQHFASLYSAELSGWCQIKVTPTMLDQQREKGTFPLIPP